MTTENNITPGADKTNKKSILDGMEEIDQIKTEDMEDSEITPLELDLLDSAGLNELGDDNELLSEAQLDNVDDDGEKLNEINDLTGEELDVPGSETDDDSEAIGEEDEENNSYSTRDQGDENDNGPL